MEWRLGKDGGENDFRGTELVFISPQPQWSSLFTKPPVDGAEILSVLQGQLCRMCTSVCLCVRVHVCACVCTCVCCMSVIININLLCTSI